MRCHKTGKRRFHDQSGAKDAVRLIRYTVTKATTNIPVRSYRCEHCNGWHITSMDAFRGNN